jgi:hypothetical protein
VDIFVLIRHNTVSKNSHVINCFTTRDKASNARYISYLKEVDKYGEESLEGVEYIVERSFLIG